MPPRKKVVAVRLPHSIVPFSNGDKTAVERWDERRAHDLSNFPHPARVLLLGPVNVGKSTLVKNLVVHQKPHFDEVYCVHEDAGATRDYEDLDPTAMMPDVPGLDFFNALPDRDEETGKRIKRAIIVDDLEVTSATKQRAKNLAILFRYASSHKSLTVYMAHQSAFDVHPIVRKMANVFILWRPNARNELALIENRVGLEKGELKQLFETVVTAHRDSITVDLTELTPCKLRLNVFTPITYDGEQPAG